MNAAQQRPSYPKTYYSILSILSSIFAALLVIVGLINAGILYTQASFGTKQGSQNTAIVIICFMVTPLLLYWAYKVRLVVLEGGIEFHNTSYTLRTSWDNIECVESISRRSNSIEALKLRQPAYLALTWWTRPWFFKQHEQVIPVGIFYGWHSGALKRDVKANAPWVAIPEKQKSADKRKGK